MFDPNTKPRVFGMAPGVDFAQALVDGIIENLKGHSPEAIAQVEIYVNTSRMRRRLAEVFAQSSAMLLPQIKLITDLASEPGTNIPPAISGLRRRLELSQLVRRLLETEESRAPRSALFDLSDSLATLMEEMHGEGVTPHDLLSLDVTDHSGHWQQSLKFIGITQQFFDNDDVPDQEARQRRVIEQKVAAWADNPPKNPIIVAGSTGSRGATALFMAAVARLEQGALVLPGFDFDLPEKVWEKVKAEDHPQYRFRLLLDNLGLTKGDVTSWSKATPPNPARNRLLSLALRPAPVTSDWIADGPSICDFDAATNGFTLLEADSPRQEAETIALRLRKAVDDGLTAALITPDRMLTRQVAAALDRWDLKPDDSAGVPLSLSAPGRLLCQLADCAGKPLPADVLLTLLKHPLANTGGTDRGPHLRFARELELQVRRYGPPYPNRQSLTGWAKDHADPDCLPWATWVSDLIERIEERGDAHLADAIASHISLAERLCSGQTDTGSGELWDKAAGREAFRMCQRLVEDADAGGPMNVVDFANIFRGVMSDGVVRDRDAGHPNILIWGTLEARVQQVDLVILGGLNEGVWPEAPAPDPWLNRQMRQDAGLLLPERRIGLSAHDFQQAVAAKDVWITRSKRTADAETVPSRWINRLTNLMEGLPDNGGPDALQHMRDRGANWAVQAGLLSKVKTEVARSQRPSPCPPVEARPKELSVTRIKTLIRDPYAIYAEKVLRLKPLNALVMEADAPLRGNIYHRVLERFIKGDPDPTSDKAVQDLINIATEEIAQDCPWPAMRLRWTGQFEALAPRFVQDEEQRQGQGHVFGLELFGKLAIPSLGFELTGVADRIDLTPDGRAIIYDYKTGQVPSAAQQAVFDKQLLLEAAMVTQGAFPKLGEKQVDHAVFVSIKPDMKVVKAPLDKTPPDHVWMNFITLIERWQNPDRGYTARMALMLKDTPSQYDHLSRYGEWTLGDAATKVRLT